MDWQQSRSEPTFGPAAVSHPRPTDRSDGVRRKLPPAYGDVPQHSSERLRTLPPAFPTATTPPDSTSEGSTSPLGPWLIVGLVVGLVIGLVELTSPQSREAIGTGLGWLLGISALIGFVALLVKYPRFANAVVAVCSIIMIFDLINSFLDHDRR